MKKIYSFFKLQIFTLLILTSTALTAQVGIGTVTPSGGALLDLTSTEKGFLVPRVDIADLSTILPITGGATTGLLVWNTRVATGVGFHYWDGNDWIPLGGSSGGNHWDLAGNTITGTEILGTLSNHDLNIRTNNLERMRVQANGQTTVGFGAGAANAGQRFSAYSAVAGDDAIAGYSYDGGDGVYGQQLANGNGVYGLVADSPSFYGNGTAVRGTNQGGLLIDFSSAGAFAATFQSGGVGVRAENFWLNNYSLHAVDGYYSVFGENNFGLDALVGDTDDTVSNAVWGRNPNAAGTAILGGANGLSIFRTGGSGIAGSGNQVGVFGYAGLGAINNANQGNAAGVFDLDTDSDPTTSGNNGTKASAMLAGFDNVQPAGTSNARNSYFGGYFDAGYRSIAPAVSPTYAYVGMRYRTGANGTSAGTTTDYKIIGTGTVSTLVNDENNVPRILFAPEAPEILFEDYGTGKLVNGQAEIAIDPILKDAIYVDSNHPLKVFIQLEGDCNGVYVTNKSENGFTVKELQNGQSNVPFSWHIVANRADTKDANGRMTSKHVGLRFPIGPGPIKPTKAEARKVLDLDNGEPSPKKKGGKGSTDLTKKEEELSSTRKQRPNK